MSEIVSVALSKLIDWSAIKIADYSKQEMIGRLLDETVIHAAMIASSVDLAAKFKDKHLVEEMLAHHTLEDKTKAEAVAIFIGSGADDEANAFVGEFYDEVTSIMATADESLADRKTLAATEDMQGDVKIIKAKMEKVATDENAQIVLLEETVKQIEASRIEVAHIAELTKTANNSLASSYLQIYYALCTDNTTDFTTIQAIGGHDQLALALASVALSANRIEDVDAALRLCSFDMDSAAKVIRKLLKEPTQVNGPMEISVPEDKDAAAFVDLANFEYFYGLNAFQAAADFASNNKIAWNPIAAERRELSDLMAASMINSSDVQALTNQALGRYRPWFPEFLTSQFKDSLAMALARLDEEHVRTVIKAMPKELSQFAQDEEKELTLRECTDVGTAVTIANWAEARQNYALLIDAAIKMLNLDEGKRPEIIKTFERCKAWAFPTAGTLDIYANLLDPEITYETYCDYGNGKENEALFHLVAYEKFRDIDSEIAKKHIERAIEIMKSMTGAPDLLKSHIWVPYLIQNDRKEELRGLVEDILPLAPYDYIMAFLSAVANCRDSDSMLDNFIESMVGSDFRDPRTAELVAQHLSSRGQTELAGRVALVAFRKAPSEVLAEIAVRWMVESSLDVDEDIIRYAEKADTAQTNLLVANLANEKGMPQRRNTYLLRAAFGNDEVSARALMLYAVWNAGNKEECKMPEEVGPDTYVTLVLGDNENTLIFLSNHGAVKAEGASGPAGTVFSTKSSEFLSCRGFRVGDTLVANGERLTISEIGAAEAYLMQAGFREIPNSSGGMAITGTPEEIRDKMTELVKSNTSRIDMYRNGYTTKNGTLYYGIETGGAISSTRQLEFTIEAVRNPSLPYKKCPISRNTALTPDNKFLLSYNALVILTLLNPPADLVDAIRDKCVVTESTARRLRKDAHVLADEPYSGSGRLGYDGEHPVFYEYNDESRRYARERSLPIIDLVDRLQTAKPSLATPNVQMVKVLTDNEVIDIQTAAINDFVFVTEDILEAQLIDHFGCANRCSISSMLLCLNRTKYMLQEYMNHMVEWGAEPVLEKDIVENLQNVIKDSFAQFGIGINFDDDENIK